MYSCWLVFVYLTCKPLHVKLQITQRSSFAPFAFRRKSLHPISTPPSAVLSQRAEWLKQTTSVAAICPPVARSEGEGGVILSRLPMRLRWRMFCSHNSNYNLRMTWLVSLDAHTKGHVYRCWWNECVRARFEAKTIQLNGKRSLSPLPLLL